VLETKIRKKKVNKPMTEAQTESRSIIARIFLSPEEKRLRSGWRLLGFFLISGISFTIFGALASFILLRVLGSNAGENSLFFILQAVAITAAIYLSRRLLDRRSFASLGVRWDGQAVRDTLVGIGIAAVMMGLIFVVEAGMGWLQFDSAPADPGSSAALLLWAGIFLLVGWYEELLSRGYLLQNLEDGLNTFWAVAISSALFGLAHLGNPNASLVSTIGILAAGVFLAYGYLRTRQLWLPIGLHIGWNFFEGPFFGFPVSGINTFRLLQHHAVGPEIITGGPFGPEAGLILLPGLALGTALIYWYTRARNPERG
jgi:hypothetical protein